MKTLHFAVSAGLAVVLSGCAGLETPKPKPALVPAAFAESSGATVEPIPPCQAEWWSMLPDPELDRLERLALAENPDLAAAGARLDEARADLAAAESALRPDLNFEPEFVRARISKNTVATAADSSPAAPLIPTRLFQNPFNTFVAPVAASYDLDVFGRLRGARDSANANTASTACDLRAARLALTTQVAATWIAIRTGESQARCAAKAADLADNEILLARDQAGEGLVDSSAVARAEAIAADEHQAAAGLRQALALQWHSLSVLCGGQAKRDDARAEGELPGAPRIPSGVPATVLARRPDVAAASARNASAVAQIAGARAQFYPQLRLTGQFGWESSRLSSLFERNSLALLAGPQLTLPLFDGGANRAAFRAAVARYDEAQSDYQSIALQALREVDDALATRAECDEQLAAARSALSAAQTAEATLTDRVAEGLLSPLSQLDSQRATLLRLRQASAIQASQITAAIELVQALGGGWGPAPVRNKLGQTSYE